MHISYNQNTANAFFVNMLIIFVNMLLLRPGPRKDGPKDGRDTCIPRTGALRADVSGRASLREAQK